AKGDEFAYPKPVPVGEQDQRRVPVAMPAEPAGGVHELVDLIGRQVLPAAPIPVRDPGRRRNFPVFGGWARAAGGPQLHDSRHRVASYFPVYNPFRERYWRADGRSRLFLEEATSSRSCHWRAGVLARVHRPAPKAGLAARAPTSPCIRRSS